MRTDLEEKVLEKLTTSDKVAIVVERQSHGKIVSDVRVLGWREGHFAGSGV
jgi:Cu/Ag efflux protein CusF